jgi:hypothetical protein
MRKSGYFLIKTRSVLYEQWEVIFLTMVDLFGFR